MGKPLKLLLSVLVFFGWALIFPVVLTPDVLATSTPMATVLLLILFVGLALGLWLIWREPQKEAVLTNAQPSKRSAGARVSGILLILFALVGGYATMTKAPDPTASMAEQAIEQAGRPLENLIAIGFAAALVLGGLKLIGVLPVREDKKE